MNESDPFAWLTEALGQLDHCELRRRRALRTGPQGALVEVDGRSLVNFASNDYLGLAADPRLADAALAACRNEGWGSGASPLVAGYSRSHHRLEQRLAEFEQTEAALLFTSGYAANIASITALASRGDAIFADALNHASLIDGCRLSRAEVHVYRHCDCEHLESLLKAHGGRRKLIVTDTLFSMDGDLAPLERIAALAAEHGCMLLVDEAHATGVFGQQGRGVCEALQIEGEIHVRVGTLSKALGSIGGFVAGSQALIDWLSNRARPYVFSTASPPAASAAACAALDIVAAEPWRRTELLALAKRLRQELAGQGWNLGNSRSQIIPIVVGTVARTLDLAEQLRQRGYWAPPIRPPSVPEGAARLRVSLSHAHSEAMVAGLANTLAKIG
jgi:8-amino-7-oxononanoate synthase